MTATPAAPITPADALSAAIFALNTLLEPSASGPADVDRLEERAGDVIAMLDALRSDHLPGPEVIVMEIDAGDEEEIRVEVDGNPYWYRHGDGVVVCPHKGCTSTEFYEVDRAERWNPTEVSETRQPDRLQKVDRWTGSGYAYVDVGPNPLAGLPMLNVRIGSDGDGFHTDHHLCQGCERKVSLPDWLVAEWTC